jgi:site-specific DNA-methyltransferase (adenine-specific)
MKNNPLHTDQVWRERLLPFCRLGPGEMWQDPDGRHRVACIDATDSPAVSRLVEATSPTLAVQDLPYNLVAFERRSIQEYVEWSRRWVRNVHAVLADNASMYVWLGADQNDGFQPLADFMIMMRDEPFEAPPRAGCAEVQS